MTKLKTIYGITTKKQMQKVVADIVAAFGGMAKIEMTTSTLKILVERNGIKETIFRALFVGNKASVQAAEGLLTEVKGV